MNARKDWVGFSENCSKAAQMYNERDKIIKVDGVEPEPAPPLLKVASAKTMAEYKDLRFFNMGAVYVFCRVPFDILAQYRQLLKYDGPRVILRFPHEIIAGLGNWGNVLEGVAVEKFDELRQFMITQAVRKDPGEYWSIRHAETIVADPLAVSRNEFNGVMPVYALDLFLPSGNKGSLSVDPRSLLPLRLMQRPAEASVLREAAILTTASPTR